MPSIFRSILSVFFLSCPIIVYGNNALSVVTEQWPPYNYVNEQGILEGIATDKVKAVLAEAGMDYQIELLAWKRAYKKAKNNKNVLLYTIYRLKEREKDFQWICPLIKTETTAVYSLADREGVKFEKIEELRPFAIGVIGTGWTYDYLQQKGFKKGVNLDIATDEYANVRKLIKGRVDFIVEEPSIVNDRLQKEEIASDKLIKVFSLFPTTHQQGCMAMSNDTPVEIINKLSAALNKLNSQKSPHSY